MVAGLLEDYTSLVESSLTKFVGLSLLNIAKNLELSENSQITSIVTKFDLKKLQFAGNDDTHKLGIACGSLTLLTNLAHQTPTRADLMGLIERTLAEVIAKLTIDSNKLLIIHTFFLYQKHVADIFVSAHADFNHVLGQVCGFIAATCHLPESPVLSVAVTTLENLFSIYKEESSEIVVEFMNKSAVDIFKILIGNVDKASDSRFFECVWKCIKACGKDIGSITGQDIANIFSKLRFRLASEIESLRSSKSLFLDADDYHSVQSIVQLAGELFWVAKKQYRDCKEPIEAFLGILVNLLVERGQRLDIAIVDMSIVILRQHIETVRAPSEIHLNFIGNYILTKKVGQFLDDNLTNLFATYLHYCLDGMPADMRDRFIMEMITFSLKNTQNKGRYLGLHICYSLILAQCLISECHESLTRSQVTDLVSHGINILPLGSNVTVAACFALLNCCLLYCPMITLECFRRRCFMPKHLSIFSRKLISVGMIRVDRQVMILALIQLLRFAEDTEIDKKTAFRYLCIMMEYHRLSADMDSLSLEDMTRHGASQRSLMMCSLSPETYEIDEEDGDELEVPKMIERKDSEDDSCSNSLLASDNSDELKFDAEFDDRHYKAIRKHIESALTAVDEYQAFRDYVKLLKENYSDTLTCLMEALTEDDKRCLKAALFVYKTMTSNGKKVLRKVYRIKRL